MPVSKPKSLAVKLNLHFFEIEGTWEPSEAEREAAWEMYVELVTRVPIIPLDPEEGILREALSSMYSLFQSTREILKAKGSAVALPKGQGELSFGYLAVAILNTVLRPVLAKWHPLLHDHESRRPAGVSVVEHERQWARYAELRQEIDTMRGPLVAYANVLAEVAGVPPLIVDRPR